ncbi:hypothetical protein BH11PLA2_BH11PLA2_03100 [soil metagenome]
MTATMTRTLTTDTRDALKRAGNPFRNYFARNPDDEVCARYHVAELFLQERELLHAIIDLYRTDPLTHSEVVPILGNKGAGKTHLLHSIKHGGSGPWQLLVTPGVYQKDTDFLEYLLFQIIDTLLGGGQQKGQRPLDAVGESLVRRHLGLALRDLTPEQKVDVFPPPGIGRWARRLGIGQAQASERAEWLAESLSGYGNLNRIPTPLVQALAEAGLSPDKALEILSAHFQKTETHNTHGMMRKAIYQNFAKAVLLRNESDLANFLTNGFAEIDFQVRPTRQDLVLALFKVLMEVFRGLKTPVVVAFDQLEDLLLARRTDDVHRIAEAFFAGIVQVMHQVDGLCVLIFAERGLWNRFVPSLDGYIQDRLNNPVHVPNRGTVKAVRLEVPPADLVRRVVEARLRPVLDELPNADEVNDIYPFNDEQIGRVAKSEPTLRDMLQQFRHLYDHMVYGEQDAEPVRRVNVVENAPTLSRIDALLGKDITVKSFDIIETAANDVIISASGLRQHAEKTAEPEKYAQPEHGKPVERSELGMLTHAARLVELWDTEFRTARRKLEPDGALTGATRELQAGLGSFLSVCHEHGVKVGPWRMQHVVPEWSFGDHPTYGVVSLAHWACKDGPPWKVGVGLFLAKGAGKPKDLEIKLGVMDQKPTIVDHLILLRPEDDLSMTGKSKQAWTDAEKKNHHARVEAVSLDALAMLYSFPRWIAAMRESLPEGMPLPNLADLIQEKCEKLLEQVCMPVQP